VEEAAAAEAAGVAAAAAAESTRIEVRSEWDQQNVQSDISASLPLDDNLQFLKL
jgi:hypothetical protein